MDRKQFIYAFRERCKELGLESSTKNYGSSQTHKAYKANDTTSVIVDEREGSACSVVVVSNKSQIVDATEHLKACAAAIDCFTGFEQEERNNIIENSLFKGNATFEYCRFSFESAAREKMYFTISEVE